MYEFNDRMSAQRSILQLINREHWPSEELFGLSSRAIDRWVAANKIDDQSPLIKLVQSVSEKLFFLANKSQEQISDQYKSARADVIAGHGAIKAELTRRTETKI
jgi:hypothetical protein